MSENGFHAYPIHGREVGLSKKLGEKLLKKIKVIEPGFKPVYICYNFITDRHMMDVMGDAGQTFLKPMLERLNRLFVIEGALERCSILKLASPHAQVYLEGEPDYENFLKVQRNKEHEGPFHYAIFAFPVVCVDPDVEETQEEFVERLLTLGIESCLEGSIGIEVDLPDWRDGH